ncbi:MAG: ABC transporter substrate-binding protein [Acidobacteriaceae bacterium]|nr:ABC transporter substrate-binding protein [Acidobacteriaceae bacterium]
MGSDSALEIVCAHSPDSDDAFMFYGLATKKVRSRKVNFRHVLEDIESLNKKATEGRYELTAVSYHAYPYIADKYVLMASGSSVGDGYGPLLVSLGRTAPRELKGKRIAIPGTMTTAFLALKLFEPEFEPVVMPFDKILDAVKDHQVDAGLIIHEGQLTYGHGGLHSIIDLGQWFRSQHNLPLPLGANALRRDLPKDIQAECSRMMRASIQHSLDHREEALNYAMQFARDLDPALADQFVGMYVNHHTVDGGEVVPRAAQKLLDLGYEAGLIPQKVTIEVVR